MPIAPSPSHASAHARPADAPPVFVAATPRQAPASAATVWLGRAGALWGVIGLSWMLLNALSRLWPMAIAPFTGEVAFGALQWVLLVGFTVFNAYAEGYRGFQKAFAPRAVNRARYLAAYPTPLRVLGAPLYLMALFGATKRRMIVNWILMAALVVLIACVRQLPVSYRAIVDMGVVIGLAWGLLAFWVFTARALLGKPPMRDPDVGADDAPAPFDYVLTPPRR